MSLRFVLPLLCAALLTAPFRASAQVAAPPRDYRVLLVGNSLTYTNNLPALLRAVVDRGMRMIADETKATIFNAAGAIEAMHKVQPDVRAYPDGVHPSTQASLMLALALYRDITGTMPVARDLRVAAPLLPVSAAVSSDSPMETQPGLAGDGKITLVPASLIEPLIRALPAPGSAEMRPSRRGR